MKPTIIIGSGLGGYVLAKEFRKLDQTSPLIIVTQQDGRFYSKPLLSSAFTHRRTLSDLVTASVEEMRHQLKAEIIVNATVTGINKNNLTLNDHLSTQASLTFSRLVLTVGASPCSLNFLKGNAVDQILSVNHLQAYEKLRHALEGKKKIGIIGCGLVGTEFANDLINGGYEVTVMAPDQAPVFRFLPLELGKAVQFALAENGVQWKLERKILEVNQHNEQLQVMLDNNEVLNFDVLMAAVGLKANTALAESAGLVVGEGIMVDRYLETSEKNIYALGDCAEVEGYSLRFVSPLMQCARALAQTLAGNKTPVMYPVLPIILKTPCIPTVFYPPFANPKGSWQVEGQGLNWKGLFYDEQAQLQGFALTGQCVKEKLEYMKKIPSLF